VQLALVLGLTVHLRYLHCSGEPPAAAGLKVFPGRAEEVVDLPLGVPTDLPDLPVGVLYRLVFVAVLVDKPAFGFGQQLGLSLLHFGAQNAELLPDDVP